MPDAEQTARYVAGSEAYRLVEHWGAAMGDAIIRGYCTAFLLALTALVGADEVRRYVDSLLPRPQPRKPRLVA